MADTKQTIDIIFQGVDKTTAAISSVIGNVERGAGKLSDLAEPIANVTTGILKFEGAILASGAALTLFAIKTAGDFDAAFREIATIIDVPIEQLGEFRQSILDYANTSTQPLDQITAAIYGAISAGVDYSDSIAAVSQAEKLAVASKADLQDTLVLLVSSLNAYGKSADDAEGFSDALFQTVKYGQTTLPELASSLAQVTGLASSAGVPFETLLAAVAALTAAGLPTSQSITSIKAALSNIIKPSSEAAKLAAELGVEFNASALESKGLEGVLLDVAKATGGNVETMGRLFGSVEGLNAVLTLTGTGAEKFATSLEAIRNSSGATELAFGDMVEALSFGNQQIENTLKTMLTAIGTPLLDEFGGIQQAIAAIFQAIGSSVDSGALGEFVQQIEVLAQQAATTLQEVARNLPRALADADFSGFIDGLNVVKKSILDLFDGADLTTAEGLKSAIEIVGNGFMTLSTFTGSAITAMGPFLEMLAKLAGFVAELNPALVMIAGGIGGIAVVAAPVLSVLANLSGLFSTLTGSSTALLAVLGNPATVAIAATVAALVAAGIGVKGLAEANNEATKAADRAASSAANLADKFRDISEATGVAVENNDDLRRAVTEGKIHFDAATGSWKAGAAAQRDYAAEVEAAKQKSYDWNKVLAEITDSQGNLIGALSRTNDAVKDSKQAAIDAAAAYHELRGTTPELARRMAELAEGDKAPLQVVSDKMDAARDSTEKLQSKMLELASNERIKGMELTVDLKLAQVAADTKKFESLMGSITASVENTGEVLLGLTSTIDEIFKGPSNKARDLITSVIESENKRRDALIQAQIDNLEAQTRALELRNDMISRGDAAIKINMDGVEPELEMIMWKIIERVQIRVNEEAAEFLLGVPGA